MRILIMASACNNLTQRVLAELGSWRSAATRSPWSSRPGGDHWREAVRRHDPELIVAPTPTTAVPEEVRSARTCLVVHPGQTWRRRSPGETRLSCSHVVEMSRFVERSAARGSGRCPHRTGGPFLPAAGRKPP